MNHVISSSSVTVTVKQHGAELCSIKGASGVEYLWRADPEIWGRHAPVLFPIVGKLAGDRYLHEGETYHLGQHGFARDMDFELVAERDDFLAFRLLPSQGTRRCYPFEFVLGMEYRLKENALEIEYGVTNNGEVVMPFSIGAHPGFSLEWGDGDEIEDYFLEFEKEEIADTRHLDENSLLSDESQRVLNGTNVLPLSRDLFARDALIFLSLESKKIGLRSHRHENRVTVEFPGFPFLGIWAKPAAPYVCIEPWHGHVDPANTDGVLMNKPGIKRLSPEATFTCLHRIVVDE